MPKKPKDISLNLTPLVLVAVAGLAIWWGGQYVAWAVDDLGCIPVLRDRVAGDDAGAYVLVLEWAAYRELR